MIDFCFSNISSASSSPSTSSFTHAHIISLSLPSFHFCYSISVYLLSFRLPVSLHLLSPSLFLFRSCFTFSLSPSDYLLTPSFSTFLLFLCHTRILNLCTALFLLLLLSVIPPFCRYLLPLTSLYAFLSTFLLSFYFLPHLSYTH